MTADEFVGLAGTRISHVTLVENLPGISAHGLMRPETLAKRARLKAGALSLRAERLGFDVGGHAVRLNGQNALLAGRKSAAEFLDGHTMESWSAQLDGRIFFWSEHAEAAFEQSHGEHPTRKLLIDARRFFEALSPHIDLAPINTGSAKRKPAPRGDWIYVPASASVDDFRLNRVRSGLKKSADDVQEISVRADIPAKVMAGLLAEG